MNELSNADKIKALFIDYLLDKSGDEIIIGSEIMFAKKRVLADLIVLKDLSVHAFEVKSPNDDFRRLQNQLLEYNKVFDFISVVTTEKHLLKAIELTPKHNGIFFVSKGKAIEVYRHPVLNANISKEEVLSTLTIKFIIEYFKLGYKKSNSTAIRKSLYNIDLQELNNAMFQFFKFRTARKFSIFMKEKGLSTHFEDIALLSLTEKKISR